MYKKIKRKLYKLIKERFHGSAAYWEKRYQSGRTSGSGSYNRLAEYKAQVLNEFVLKEKIASVIEFGCGDGNQLKLMQYPQYIGLDVSKTAVQICINKFESDRTKSFFLYDSKAFRDSQGVFNADLSLSLDVIYHLVEDEIFHAYMMHLFNSAKHYVIIYSSDYDSKTMNHVRDRQFSRWIQAHKPEWSLMSKLENPYRFDLNDMENTSRSDFFIYKREL